MSEGLGWVVEALSFAGMRVCSEPALARVGARYRLGTGD